MVTLRRSTRRSVRLGGSAEKSANPARTSSSNTFPVQSHPDPPIPVTISANPTPTQAPIPSFPTINTSSDSLDFGGNQYSPYFLTSDDNPGTSLIYEVLNGSNYNTWNIAMAIAADEKNKILFVDGSLPRLSEWHPHYRIW